MRPLPVSAQLKLASIDGVAVDTKDAALSAQRRISELIGVLEKTEDQGIYAGIEHEIGRLRAVQGAANQRHREFASLAAQLHAWLGTFHPKQSFEEVRPPKVKLRNGDTYLAAIERIRRDVAELQGELRSVRRAAKPTSDLKDLAAAYVTKLAHSSAPTLTFEGENIKVHFAPPEKFSAPPVGDRIAAAVAWLDPERFTARLHDMIERLPTPPLALSTDEKRQRIDRLTAQLDALEREEEAFIVAADAAGQSIARRTNASAPAVLGVALAQRGERRAAVT